ncbi:MAG: hypothetical protein ACM319_07445 [Deltaproteobacteria bacterium]|nr:hypothetical protein [Candidatus Deferrimicrobiaceae bacterium]
MRQFLVLLAASYAGVAASVWWLSGYVPWFLLPDVPFLAIVYAGLFLGGPAGLLAAIPSAVFREVTVSAPPWTFFLSSMALYFVSREIALRLFVRAEYYILTVVVGLLLAESLSVVLLMLLSGSRPFSLLWGAEEAVRIAWTGLLAVPLYMDLSSRWLRVKE